jgi:glycosyltransferase involved in cell wall biosynthesis
MSAALITPLVLTFNEEANIDRTLARLAWARRVVVIDSFSTDATVARCRAYGNVEVHQRAFDNHVAQWNFGLDQVASGWVLSLDADYVLTDALVAELAGWSEQTGIDGYEARFIYCVFGRQLRASLYPPRTVLFRRDRADYVSDGHTQRLRLKGTAGSLTAAILHDDRKAIDRWLAEQLKYAALEAAHLATMPPDALSRADRLRRGIIWAPLVVAAYALVGRGLVLDGWPGLFYVLQRVTAECLLSVRLLDARLRGPVGAPQAGS